MRIKLANYYGRVRLIEHADGVTYLGLNNWSGMKGLALTAEEAATARALFASIGEREPLMLNDDGSVTEADDEYLREDDKDTEV